MDRGAPALGMDLGGTRVKAGLVADGKLVASVVRNLNDNDRTEGGAIEMLARVALDACDEADVRLEATKGIGIGAPGALRHRDGVIVKSPNFGLWKDFHLAERLGKHTGVPVFLDNDANVVTLGEAMFGAGRGVGDFACLTLGSGVGGGLFLGGDVYRGADGMAGEIGHVVVEPEGFPCGCGGRGCLEQYSSSNGIRNMVAGDDGVVAGKSVRLDDPDLSRIVYEAAASGDEACRGYFEEFGYRLAIAVGGLLNLLNIHTVVISGGLAHAWDAFAPSMMRHLPTRGYRTIVEAANVVPCELWESGGVLGAAALVISESR